MATSRVETFTRKASWEQASLESGGYEETDLVSTLTARAAEERPWTQVIESAYVQGREMELIHALQTVVSFLKNPETLDVADVGGGNGYMAAIARHRMHFQRFQWTIFESKAVSDSYQRFESESEILWMENVERNFDRVVDIAIVSCTMHYLSEPHALLNFLSTKSQYLLLMRVPLVDEPEDIPTIQSPNDGIYAQVNAHWPAWFLSRTRFDATLKEVGDVVFRWFTNEVWQFEGEPILLEGVLLRTKAARSPA